MKENSYSSVKTSDDEISVDTNYAAYIIMFYEGKNVIYSNLIVCNCELLL